MFLYLEWLAHRKKSSFSFRDQAHKSSISLLQKVVNKEVVDMQKIHTDVNLADIMTKPINTNKLYTVSPRVT